LAAARGGTGAAAAAGMEAPCRGRRRRGRSQRA
jgi:hypothetical protein